MCPFVLRLCSLHDVPGSRNYTRLEHAQPVAEEPIEDVELLWFNERSREELLQDQAYATQISTLEKHNPRFFNELTECGEYIYGLSANTKVILIVDERWAGETIMMTQEWCSVRFIFAIQSAEQSTGTPNDSGRQHLKVIRHGKSSISPHSPALQVKRTSIAQLADQIDYFQARFHRSTKEFFVGDIFKASRTVESSSNKLDGNLLWAQLLLDILLGMKPRLTDKDEFIARFRQRFAEEPQNLESLKEFQATYERETVFEWYSRPTFVYQCVNRALRTRDMDLLFLCRFLLQDMHHQLTFHQQQSAVKVYRGQRISKDEWNALSNSIDDYISITSFLSTSFEESVAKFYIGEGEHGKASSTEMLVLFEIHADPHLTGNVRPFADISPFSYFSTEREVLFVPGSIFKITGVVFQDPFPIMKMELCSDEENTLKPLLQSLQREYGGQALGFDNEATLNSLGIVLYEMGDLHAADSLFRRVYNESDPDDPQRARYCCNIGNAAQHSGRYKESARWYERALQLSENIPTMYVCTGQLHLCRANLFTKMKDTRRALSIL